MNITERGDRGVKGRVALQITLMYTKYKGDLAYLYLFVENLKIFKLGMLNSLLNMFLTKFADYQLQLVGMIFLRVFMEFLGEKSSIHGFLR